MSKLLILFMCSAVLSLSLDCDEMSVLNNLKIPTYDFSVRLLDKVAEVTDGHFVFSPFSTWLELLGLSEGAQGETLNDILDLMRQNDTLCFSKSTRNVINTLDKELSETMKHLRVFVIDELIKSKEEFGANVESLNTSKVMSLNFRDAEGSAAKVNEYINNETNGLISEGLDADSFMLSVLLLIEVNWMKANWLSPFNRAFTRSELFYSYEKVPLGYVKMMSQIGSFYLNDIPEIDSQALELPFNDRASMILLLPNSGPASTLFLSLKETNIASLLTLLNANSPKLVSVKLPKFKMSTKIDNVPELLDDMGAHRMFLTRFAKFPKLSDYRIMVSMMTHKANIEVTETGVTANASPYLIVKPEDAVNISFNRPFAYLVIDKISNVILFAGVYSKP